MLINERTSLLVALLFLLFSVHAAMAYVTISFDDQKDGYYISGEQLKGNVIIEFNEAFDRNSILKTCIDECTVSSPSPISLYNYMYDEDEYVYQPQDVTYYINSSGRSYWDEYTDQTFRFNVSASGTCGDIEKCTNIADCDCYSTCSATNGLTPCCNEQYPPCHWSDWSESSNQDISANEGLKFFYGTISEPGDHNSDTKWTVDISFGQNVDGTMRTTCGNQAYETYGKTTPSGWVMRKNTSLSILLCSQDACTNPSNHYYSFCTSVNGLCPGEGWAQYGAGIWNCIEDFDEESLGRPNGQPYRKYGGPEPAEFSDIKIDPLEFGGGIYKSTDNGNTWEYQAYNVNSLIWNATQYVNSIFPQLTCNGLGYIHITNWDPSAMYSIVYLPPKGDREGYIDPGNKFCGYTDVIIPRNELWTNYGTGQNEGCSNCASYGNPYRKTFDLTTELGYLNKPCPDGTQDPCGDATGYTGYVTDPDLAISTAYRSGNRELDVEVTTSVMTFAYKNQTSVNISKFTKLKAPQSGDHKLMIFVVNKSGSGDVVSSLTYDLSISTDKDGDGWGVDGGDCNDSNSAVYPGAEEICDGFDNDCNDEIDEGFNDPDADPPKKSGEPCYDWDYSVCSGIWVCNEDGTELVCNGEFQPGEQIEICANGLDDDCDRDRDENYEYNDKGEEVIACGFAPCTHGKMKECGPHLGVCEPGRSLCINGVWSDCKDAHGPFDEVCNTLDDDCDGTIDDVDNENSIEDTACGCYDGAEPRTEICNDIDDNCNGQIDEGLRCCRDGNTRICGEERGICTTGMEECIDGRWSGVCQGGVKPQHEICYDSIDNDCDGEADELCKAEVTCHNKLQDLNEAGVDCGGPCDKACDDASSWIIFAAIIMAVIIIAGVLEYTGKL